MIEFAAITSVISKYAPQAGRLIIKQAQKNEAVIKVLQELKLNPTQIPDDVDGVYAYTLLTYSQPYKGRDSSFKQQLQA